MSKIKNGALEQYGTEPFEQQQFGTAGVEWVNAWIAEPKHVATGGREAAAPRLTSCPRPESYAYVTPTLYQ